MSVYVGIDVHRKRSQVAVTGADGGVLANRNVPSGAEPILGVIGGLPPGTPTAFEAGFGTGWLVELLEDYGFDPHLVHPSRCKAIASARLKNDKAGAAILGQLLRADLLPGAWIAPPPVRQLRALLRNRIHAIVAEHGYDRPDGGYRTGPGRAWLAALELPAVSRELAGDDLGLTGALQERVDRLEPEIRQQARSDPRVKVLTQLPGVGPFTALVILAEVGEVSRFALARKLASWAGLTPTVRGSDRVAHYGHISKQGSVWLRWVLCEAAQTAKRSPEFAAAFQRIAKRRGNKIATTAVARKLLTRAWHLLTDAGYAAPPQPAAPPESGAVTSPGEGRLARASSKINLSRARPMLGELTEQPGPRITWSWQPSPGRPNGWM
jgi:transposase